MADYLLVNELPHETQFELADVAPPHKKTLVRLVVDSGLIQICPEGYGDNGSADGHGCPIMIEFCEGQLRVICWDDINSADPTIVRMEGARESARSAT